MNLAVEKKLNKFQKYFEMKKAIEKQERELKTLKAAIVDELHNRNVKEIIRNNLKISLVEFDKPYIDTKRLKTEKKKIYEKYKKYCQIEQLRVKEV